MSTSKVEKSKTVTVASTKAPTASKPSTAAKQTTTSSSSSSSSGSSGHNDNIRGIVIAGLVFTVFTFLILVGVLVTAALFVPKLINNVKDDSNNDDNNNDNNGNNGDNGDFYEGI
jgi:hypothetical protein